jgi:DNA-binding NarL/FixJ family response regulator
LDAVPQQYLLDAHTAPASQPSSPFPIDLTRREIEVLRLVAKGMSNNKIADRLFLSTNTVRAHVYSIYNKLDITSRSDATRYAFEHNLAG